MTPHSKSPAEWQRKWHQNRIPRIEYIEGLIYTAQFVPPQEVLASLDPSEAAYFAETLVYAAAIPDHQEPIKYGNPPDWRPQDARTLLEHLRTLGWTIPEMVHYSEEELPTKLETLLNRGVGKG